MGKRTIKRKRKQRSKPHIDAVPLSELKSIILQLKSGKPVSLNEADKLEGAIDTLAVVTSELEQKRVSVARLKMLLFGEATEKLSNVFPEISAKAKQDEAQPPAQETEERDGGKDAGERAKRKGHGRNPVSQYTGAQKQTHKHDSLTHKGPCPEEGCDGKLYLQKEPKRLVRVTGVAPVRAMVHELERLRCNLCGKIFTAKAPDGVGDETYDNRARAMMALLKYGCGMPFYRLERLEKDLGIPLPTSTQWDEVHKLAMTAAPVYTELIATAANGKVLHNDDTTARILELSSPPLIGKNGKERTGLYTSGIISLKDTLEIALFFTGRRHAGENLEKVLAHRNEELSAPIQMCDAISANTSGDFECLLAGCNSHARRKFVEVAGAYPQEVLHILKVFKQVYQNDDDAKGMSDEDRMGYHVTRSKPLLDDLCEWFHKQVEVDRTVEPNSSLGDAIAYMQDHWEKLTLFLRVPGAPLDNNVCERAIKKAVLHRKNALFFKTENGAYVADLFMSIIHTCELQGINPFEYLTAVADNAVAVTDAPADWLPWAWQRTLKK